MTSRLRITGGTVVTAAGAMKLDVSCADGRIVALHDADEHVVADEQLDARGMLVFPGFIDPHVHSRDPGLTEKEDFAHATRAAAAGGVTTILEMPNTVPPLATERLFADRAEYHSRSAHVDYALWGMALGLENASELKGMLDAGAVGIKLFWGYAIDRKSRQLIYNLAERADDATVAPLTAGEAYELFREVAAAGGLLAAHCEDRDVLVAARRALGDGIRDYADFLRSRPSVAESLHVAAGCELALATGCHFHVLHMSSGRSAAILAAAQAAGAPVTAETCPQYLTLDAAAWGDLGARMKLYPPIRTSNDREALWSAIRSGSIATVSSDHGPHTIEEKSQSFEAQPAGLVGVETLAPLMIDHTLAGRITLEQLAWVLSEGTARVYGLYPRKGALQPGSDADLTVVDPEADFLLQDRNLHSKNPYSLWDNRRCRGRPVYAVLRGHVIMADGEPVGGVVGRLVTPERCGRPVRRTAKPPMARRTSDIPSRRIEATSVQEER